MRPSRLRPLQLLQNEEPGTFRDHEAVPVARERARGSLWLGIPTRGQDAHRHEAAQDKRRNGRVDAAGDHQVQDPRLDVAASVSERIGRGRAARRDNVAEAPESESHRDFTGQGPDRRRWNDIYAALAPMAGVIKTVLLLGKFVAAASGPDD